MCWLCSGAGEDEPVCTHCHGDALLHVSFKLQLYGSGEGHFKLKISILSQQRIIIA